MKAVLEIEAPKSCSECKLRQYKTNMVSQCAAIGIELLPTPTDNRHPHCPLKVVNNNRYLDLEIGRTAVLNITLKAVKGKQGISGTECHKCALDKRNCLKFHCSKLHRKDGQNVYFVEA
jgi:hypothetical protein